MRSILILAALLATGAAVAQTAAPIIPRELLFGNPTRSQARISPDGRHVSWLAPVDGVMNVWVAPASDPAAAKPLTREAKRGLQQHQWAPDSRHIFYLQDDGGTENWRVHVVDVATGTDRDLMPVKTGARVDIAGLSRLRPEVVLLQNNARDPQFFDLFEVDYRTGASKLVLENPGYGQIIPDNQLRPRLATQNLPGGGTTVFRRAADGKWSELTKIAAEDFFGFQPIGFGADERTVYMIDARGRDTAALVAMDAETGKVRALGANDRADVNNVVIDPVTFEAVAYSSNRLKGEWTAVGPRFAADLTFLRSKLSGEIGITGATDDATKMIVTATAAEQPQIGYVYDRSAKTLTKLIETRPDLAPFRLAPMRATEVRARDGLDLVTYVTLPVGSDADADGVPDRPLPTVLFVHGGPWARDAYGYVSSHQWLANRGYAVISTNYRGSTGFGKKFVNAAVGQWSGKMHDDLIDVVDWAGKQGIADSRKTAIMGGSYGGYAALVGVTFTPDRFACGVSIVGPSNLKTLMESFPPYWRPILAGTFYKHIGDPAVPADVTRMIAQSPISRVAAIKVPLLVGQGGNDPRVVKAESDQIVAAMKARSLPVTYVNFPDEGHGFVRPQNRLAFNAVAEGFLAQCLGGRAEPIGDDLTGSSLEVVEGASGVAGLETALRTRAPSGQPGGSR